MHCSAALVTSLWVADLIRQVSQWSIYADKGWWWMILAQCHDRLLELMLFFDEHLSSRLALTVAASQGYALSDSWEMIHVLLHDTSLYLGGRQLARPTQKVSGISSNLHEYRVSDLVDYIVLSGIACFKPHWILGYFFEGLTRVIEM
jgi:hypothetical protein